MANHMTKTYKRLLSLPINSSYSAFLFGPRGTGKTSWIKKQIQPTVYIDLLQVETYRVFINHPSSLEKYIPQNHQGWIVIDEIQKVPSLLNEVHRLIENNHYRFLLTGSSARKLRQKGVNLLAGRALEYHMHPLTCEELGDDFSLNKALSFGMLPSLYATENDDPTHYLESYVNMYLKEEVQQEGLVRNIAEFSRFLEIASFSQGQCVNYSEIAREAAIERRVVSHYFDITCDLLLGQFLPVFSKRAKRKITAQPKFYFFDTGVYRTLRPAGPLDITEEIDGAALETLFFQHLVAFNDYDRLGYEFFYWRTATQLEVDFIAYGKGGLFAFEIKRKRIIASRDLTGLKAFKADYPAAQCYIIYGGEHEEYHGDITAVPLQMMLFRLRKLLKRV